MKISLIIPCHKRPELLRYSLLCALDQDYPDYEIILVEDGTDNKELFNEFSIENSRLRYFSQPYKGYARLARISNIGAEQAQGELLIFIDGDVLIEPSFISKHVDYHKKHKTSVIIGRGVQLARNAVSVNNASINFEKIKQNLLLDAKKDEVLRAGMFEQEEYIASPKEKAFLYGYNVSVMKTDYLAAGQFNELFMGWAFTDSEFNLKLRHAGIKEVYVREPCVYHQWHERNTSFSFLNTSHFLFNSLSKHKYFKHEAEQQMYVIGLAKRYLCIKKALFNMCRMFVLLVCIHALHIFVNQTLLLFLFVDLFLDDLIFRYFGNILNQAWNIKWDLKKVLLPMVALAKIGILFAIWFVSWPILLLYLVLFFLFELGLRRIFIF